MMFKGDMTLDSATQEAKFLPLSIDTTEYGIFVRVYYNLVKDETISPNQRSFDVNGADRRFRTVAYVPDYITCKKDNDPNDWEPSTWANYDNSIQAPWSETEDSNRDDFLDKLNGTSVRSWSSQGDTHYIKYYAYSNGVRAAGANTVMSTDDRGVDTLRYIAMPKY
jgi:hypothetical protein